MPYLLAGTYCTGDPFSTAVWATYGRKFEGTDIHGHPSAKLDAKMHETKARMHSTNKKLEAIAPTQMESDAQANFTDKHKFLREKEERKRRSASLPSIPASISIDKLCHESEYGSKYRIHPEVLTKQEATTPRTRRYRVTTNGKKTPMSRTHA